MTEPLSRHYDFVDIATDHLDDATLLQLLAVVVQRSHHYGYKTIYMAVATSSIDKKEGMTARIHSKPELWVSLGDLFVERQNVFATVQVVEAWMREAYKISRPGERSLLTGLLYLSVPLRLPRVE